MITFTFNDATGIHFSCFVRGVPVYLDNFALIRLAKGDPVRKRRFTEALRSGADLLFSVTNAAELIGPQGATATKLRDFLDEIGPHWFPIELNPIEVVERELKGAGLLDSCISQDFLKRYFAAQLGGSFSNLSETMVLLGAVLDWLGPQRDSILDGMAKLDEALIQKIERHRIELEHEPQRLNEKFPMLQFNGLQPATFTYVNLVRNLILEAKAYRLKKGDGGDFCHAVMAGAFARFATLDKHWKRRIEVLPTPNKIARIYYQPELDSMIADIECVVESLQR
jgi:hypothetical protein